MIVHIRLVTFQNIYNSFMERIIHSYYSLTLTFLYYLHNTFLFLLYLYLIYLTTQSAS